MECANLRSQLGFRHRIEETKELLHSRHCQRGVNPVTHADQSQETSFFVVSDVGTNQGSDPGGVDVRNCGKVDDQRAGIFGPNRGLKLEQSSKNYRALKAQNPLVGLRTGQIINDKGQIRQ